MEEPQSYKYKLTIAYDGTHYSGWQVQPNGLSIQELLQDKLSIITREETQVTGSGRTDAGVHALGQTAHFTSSAPLSLSRVKHSLNGLLPKDIRIDDLIEVPLSFHARYSAIAKSYHYHLHLALVESPFHRLYSWHVTHQIDVDLLTEAAKHFVGTHDFTSFANEAHRGSAAHDAVRTIESVNVVREDGGVRIEFTGDGFLYKMVRNMVGILVEIAAGSRPVDAIPKVLAAKDRKASGKSAPPHGLFLVNVFYP